MTGDQSPDFPGLAPVTFNHSNGQEVIMQVLLSSVAADASTIYLGWGAFTIQLGNFIVIAVMLLLFVLALVLPFPAGRKRK